MSIGMQCIFCPAIAEGTNGPTARYIPTEALGFIERDEYTRDTIQYRDCSYRADDDGQVWQYCLGECPAYSGL